MKTVSINKKVTFTAIVMLGALLYAQESLTHIIDSGRVQVTGPIPIGKFKEKGKYHVYTVAPFDVIYNANNSDLNVIIHNDKRTCARITMTIPALSVQEVPDTKCNTYETRTKFDFATVGAHPKKSTLDVSQLDIGEKYNKEAVRYITVDHANENPLSVEFYELDSILKL